MRLAGKVALITGGASGIGLVMVERFATEGATVAMVDRDAVRGERAVADLSARGYAVHFAGADLTQPAEIMRAVEASIAQCGRLDIVVNNAGIIIRRGIGEMTATEWDTLFAVNVRAAFLVIKAALPALKQSHGNILNVSSTCGFTGSAGNTMYATSKGALLTLTKSLAAELHPYGIRVNCICPGAVDTPLSRAGLAERGLDEAGIAKALDALQERGILTVPRQIADTALYLVGDEASAVTGSIVIADAGAMLL